MLSILGRQFEFSNSVGGYNLCYLRDGATQCAVSIDEYQAPIVAAWQSGIGRTLCYTPQADGPFTGDIVQCRKSVRSSPAWPTGSPAPRALSAKTWS